MTKTDFILSIVANSGKDIRTFEEADVIMAEASDLYDYIIQKYPYPESKKVGFKKQTK